MSELDTLSRAKVLGPVSGRASEILTPEALDFLAGLHRNFDARRRQLLAARVTRQARFDAGETPDFLAETADIRDGDWKVAPIPADIQDRRVEITGPVERKMIINALNSGAPASLWPILKTATQPHLEKTRLSGQINLCDDQFGPRRSASPSRRTGKNYKV